MRTWATSHCWTRQLETKGITHQTRELRGRKSKRQPNHHVGGFVTVIITDSEGGVNNAVNWDNNRPTEWHNDVVQVKLQRPPKVRRDMTVANCNELTGESVTQCSGCADVGG